MLGLKLPTDPRWANIVEKDLEEILTDHAYCEQKAAMSGITLIQQYPDKIQMVRELSPIVAEEWEHFRFVLAELDRRNLKLGAQRKDEYVNNLISFQKKGGSRDMRFLEKLLTFALIEARSCERFRILSVNLLDEELKAFYHKFMVSEAGHYRLFLDLATHYFPESEVKSRWEEYLVFEAEMIQNLELRPDRVH